jgi:hypothetical protein
MWRWGSGKGENGDIVSFQKDNSKYDSWDAGDVCASLCCEEGVWTPLCCEIQVLGELNKELHKTHRTNRQSIGVPKVEYRPTDRSRPEKRRLTVL